MKILSIIAIAVFLGVMLMSLFNMSMGMDMSDGMSDCPFMTEHETLCPMNLVEHISAWQSVFIVTIPILSILTLAISAFVFAFKFAPRLLTSLLYLYKEHLKFYKKRLLKYDQRPLQELFSNGILNPKLF